VQLRILFWASYPRSAECSSEISLYGLWILTNHAVYRSCEYQCYLYTRYTMSLFLFEDMSWISRQGIWRYGMSLQDFLSKDCVLLSRMLWSRPVPCSVADFTHFFCFTTLPVMGAHGGIVVKALCYKPAGRGFNSQWCHWNFSAT
jgi:hypothetical protein